MKHIILAISLSIIFLSVTSSAQNRHKVAFSGQIKNATNHELIFYDVNNKKTTIRVDNTGHFTDSIEVAYVGHRRFYDDKKKLDLYFERGKDLHVSYDAADFKKTVIFSGPGAAANNYILRKEAIKARQAERFAADSINHFSLSESAYREIYLGLKKAMLQALSATRALSDQYKRLEAKNINYEYLYFLSQYELVQINHMGNKNFKTSESVRHEYDEIVYTNEEDFLFSEMYRNLVQSTYYEKAGKVSEAERKPRDVAYLATVSTINNVYIRNYLLYNFASRYLNYSTDVDGFYQTFMKGSSNEQDKAKIAAMYQTVKTVKANSVSPKFINYENYAGGTSSLDDFKGKYIFIDVWATWCGPCVHEFPYLDTLENAYKGKNIQFVTISIDTKANKQKWREFVKEKDLDGVQLLADNAFESPFIKAYNINGIPRFLIIDPKGNIVSNNAPRPSDPKLKELLDSLPL